MVKRRTFSKISKENNYNFDETIKSKSPWIASLLYHSTVIYLNNILPVKTVTEIKKVVYTTSVKAPPPSTQSQINLSAFLNIMFFDLIFIVIFYIASKSGRKIYDIWGVAAVVVITNLLLRLFTNIL